MTAPSALTLPKGGSVAMGISVSTHDADDTVTVKISGLKAYESITDNIDATVFTGSPLILPGAEVDSGLSLHSTYGGAGQPVNTLTVTASITTSGEKVSSAPKTITVTDPPATVGAIALLGQCAASSFVTTGGGSGTTPVNDSAAAQPPSLAPPQHG